MPTPCKSSATSISFPAQRPCSSIAKDREEALLTATRLRSVTRRFLDLEPELTGWFLDDPEIAASIHTQVPFRLGLAPDTPARRSLASLAASLLARLPLTASREINR